MSGNYNGYTLSCQGEGCDSYSDHLAGLVDVAKTPAGTPTEHYKLRTMQTTESTIRELGWKPQPNVPYSRGGR